MKNFRATLLFRTIASCSKFWMIKNQWRAVRGGKGGFGSLNIIMKCAKRIRIKITNWIKNICPFMLQRCNYCMILIIFIVNTSEFAYFFFKWGESHEGRQWLLVPPPTGWLSYWVVCYNLCWWALAVQLPLCQPCNLHVSYSVNSVFQGKRRVAQKSWMVRNIFNAVKIFKGNCFSGQVAKKSWTVKIFSMQCIQCIFTWGWSV